MKKKGVDFSPRAFHPGLGAIGQNDDVDVDFFVVRAGSGSVRAARIAASRGATR